MIADYFPKERLSSALSVYAMGIQIGAGLALMVGGLVVQAVMHLPDVSVPMFGSMAPWRVTFLVVGMPGVLVAALLATVREPVRRRLAASSATRPMQSVRRVVAELRARWQSASGVSIIMACQAMSNYAFGSWTPAYFERIHHWPKSHAGLVLGALTLGCGCVGLFCGGRLSDRWLKRDVHEAPLRVGLVSLVGVAITLVPAMLTPSAGWTIALLIPAVFFLALPIGCSYASIQMIFQNEVRGAVSAVMLLVLNLFGLTLGTLLPGLLDDRLFHNDQMLGASIAITAGIASSIGAVTALVTFAPYRRDFAAMHTPGAEAR
jgi:MFS family permease